MKRPKEIPDNAFRAIQNDTRTNQRNKTVGQKGWAWQEGRCLAVFISDIVLSAKGGGVNFAWAIEPGEVRPVYSGVDTEPNQEKIAQLISISGEATALGTHGNAYCLVDDERGLYWRKLPDLPTQEEVISE